MARAAGADGKRGCRRKQHRGRLGVGAGARAEHRLVAMASATTRSTSVARRPSAGRRQAERLSLRRRRCERAVQRPAGSAPSRWPGREVMQPCRYANGLPLRTIVAAFPSPTVSRVRLGNRRPEHRIEAIAEQSSNAAPKSSARVGARAQVVRRWHRRLFGLGRVFLQKLRYTDGIINGVGGACSFASYLQQLPTMPLV